MKSTPVRSFGKVFETSLGKSLGKVLGKALRCHLLCLIVLCVIVGCSDDSSDEEHIVSPYTEQTMEFFERSGSDVRPNVLETIEIDGERCILKKQTQAVRISLEKYTLETVPEQLAQGIEFDRLVVEPSGPVDPAVLEKILSAFGTINAEWLDLADLEIDDPSPYNDEHPRTPMCALNVDTFQVTTTPKTTIEWLQKRVVLSGFPIELVIDCMPNFGNLEVLDGFCAGEIISLMLYGIDNLDSLDCKLLREGPLPDELVLHSNTPTAPEISEQITRNMLSNRWHMLTVPVSVWHVLAESSAQYNSPVSADYLTIGLPLGGKLARTAVKKKQAEVENLVIEFHEDQPLVTRQDMTSALVWASRSFEGLQSLSIVSEPDAIDEADLASNNHFEITATPATAVVMVNQVLCGVARKRPRTLP
ncbi:hypothetical protein NEDG_02213 [Nematocida displodere]|uniref:Uncharacterized protein n=1 Tax=Nematocida displodere TaxID=1805483 RepID=A0A177ED38_9MICR|nr:hypothetical protein NEDG_02213 [Nematocida displodere]